MESETIESNYITQIADKIIDYKHRKKTLPQYLVVGKSIFGFLSKELIKNYNKELNANSLVLGLRLELSDNPNEMSVK